ncbi:SGNH hydrolase [Lentithecium fluviatile CBS 122367]|uniref:SGNH hydrolase n=1 Tax=Lentithecium fluviatile CBS 122367 TaxID=1168545 RepID=A0A6G1IV57_9PLEO|nr:SGNH hydrolase [Lentithecium fluviatile CBS 122367]
MSFGGEKLPQIVLFGDSLTAWGFDEKTQGFGWYLQKMYKGKADIVNEGYAGYTSQAIKRNFTRLITRLTAPGAPETLLVTIFLGANDACIIGDSEYVPLPLFTSNICEFVEEILIQDDLPNAKIVLITPPPVNVPDPLPDPLPGVGEEGDEEDARNDMGFRTYMSKKRYAKGIMAISGEYAETERVVGVDFWRACVEEALVGQGRGEELEGEGKGERFEDVRLPGCGLKTAKRFPEGWFTDGLHLGPLGYKVLSKALVDTVLAKWPELSPGKIGV